MPGALIHRLMGCTTSSAGSRTLGGMLCSILSAPMDPRLLPPGSKSVTRGARSLMKPCRLRSFFLCFVLHFKCRPDGVFHVTYVAFSNRCSGRAVFG